MARYSQGLGGVWLGMEKSWKYYYIRHIKVSMEDNFNIIINKIYEHNNATNSGFNKTMISILVKEPRRRKN